MYMYMYIRNYVFQLHVHMNMYKTTLHMYMYMINEYMIKSMNHNSLGCKKSHIHVYHTGLDVKNGSHPVYGCTCTYFPLFYITILRIASFPGSPLRERILTY